jgi:FtsX-like permease family
MGAVWLRSRSELRHRWKAWLAVALLAGIGGGIATGAFAAAERVERTYPEFVEAGHPMDVLVPGASPFGLVGGVDLNQVGRLPEVADTADASAALLFAGRTPGGRLIGPGDVFPVAAAGNALGTTFEKFTILEGRAARPFAVREATASFVAADKLHLEVGDTVRIHFFRADSFLQTASKLLTQFNARLNSPGRDSVTDYARLADGPDIAFKIVGIEASPGEFPPLPADISPTIHLTPAFYQRFNDQIVQSPLLYTRLERGNADLPSFERRVEQMAGNQPVAFVTTRASLEVRVQRAIRVQATALRLFALIVLAAFVVLMQQTISRQIRADSTEDSTLRTLGMSTRQIFSLPMLWAALVAIPAAALAAGVALLLSPFGVVGLARQANAHPGFAVDGPVLAIGILAVLFGIPLLTLWPAIRRVRAARGTTRRDRPDRPSRLAQWLGRAGASPSSSVGVGFGLSAGRGASSVPVQSALVGFTLAVGLLVATLGFSASLQRLLDSPPLYGWTWDIKTGAPALPDLGGLVIPALQADSDIDAVAAGTAIQMDLEDHRVDALAMTLAKGALSPAIVDGRAPRQIGDIVVGAKTLHDIGKDLGDTVTARIGKRSVRMKLVGTAVFPPFGDVGQFGSGVLITYAQLKALVPEARQNVFLLKLTPGTSVAREYVHMRDALEPLPTRTAQRPTDLDNLDSISGLQAALIAILAVLAAATLAHTLLTSVRRRSKSIALLRTMGFSRRQISAVVVVQALTLVVASLVIGVVLGVIGARWAWALFADNLGVVAGSVFPWISLAVLIPAALVLAVLVASVPALLASRAHPADALRDQ